MDSQGENPKSSAIGAQIDQLCDRFEAAWKSGTPPDLTSYLLEIEETSRPLALRELLRVELELRRARGESPTLDEYQRRFHEHTELVIEAFQSLHRRELETIDTPQALLTVGFHVRCPHCHNPIELVPDANLSDIECKSCGGSFSLTGSDQVAPQAGVATRIGHFELIERLGMGAFGTVWRALDTKLDRSVAVKIPRKGQLDAAETEMFLREARSAAQLRHANIVSVHEVGRDNDSVYLVSDLIQGMSLDKWLADQQLAPREAAEICAKIANALQHAHEKGVIHRDLKPQNILMDASGEPHLTDFGLAKREAGEITMTMEGQLLGTPAYMSPEQARGESHTADQRSDVYSLGVVLFQLLTGELPFRGNVRMLLKQVLEDDAPAARQLDNRIPRDLDTICQKCLAKEPAKRYPTARALADDLQRFLRGEVIQARPVKRMERTWRWCKRNPIVATSLAVATILLAGMTWSWTSESQQRKLGETRLENSRHNVYNLSLARAAALIERKPDSAKAILEDAAACPWDLHDFVWRVLHRAADGQPVTRTVQHLSRVTNVAYSADGKTLAAAAPGKVVYWDVTSGKQKRTVAVADGDVTSLALSSDGTVTIISTPSGHATLLSFRREKKDQGISAEKSNTIDFNRLRDAQQLQNIESNRKEFDQAKEVPFSGDGLTSRDGLPDNYPIVPVMSNTATRPEWRGSIEAQLQSVLSGCFSPNQMLLATTGRNGIAAIWEARQIERGGNDAINFLHPRKVLIVQEGDVRCAIFTPDSTKLITGGDDHSIRIWDVQTAKIRAAMPGHTGAVTCLAIAADGNILVSGSQDSSVRVWDLTKGSEIGATNLNKSGVHSLAIAQDGKHFAACGNDGSFQEWSLAENKLTPIVPSAGLQIPIVYSVAYAPDGKSLALATSDGSVLIVDAAMQKESGRFAIRSAVTAVAASSDGATVASGSCDGTIKLWDASTGREKRTFTAAPGEIDGLAFSLDDTLLASLDTGGAVTLWNVDSGKQLAIRNVPGAQSVAFSPNGDSLLAGDAGRWTLWDLTSGECHEPPWQSAIMAASAKSGNMSISPRSAQVAIFELNRYSHSDAVWDWTVGNEVRTPDRDYSAASVAVWDWATRKRVRKTNIPREEYWGVLEFERTVKDIVSSRSVAISATSPMVAIGTRIWDSASQQAVGDMEAGSRRSVFSPDGRTLVRYPDFSLWDPDVVQQRPTLIGSDGALPAARAATAAVTHCAFSWDGSVLVAGQEDGQILILNAGRRLAKIANVEKAEVRLSEDDRKLICLDVVDCVRDAKTGNILLELERNANTVVSANGEFAAQLSTRDGMRLTTWSTATLRQKSSRSLDLNEHARPIAISNDGTRLAFMYDDPQRIVEKTPDGEISGHWGKVIEIYSRQGRKLSTIFSAPEDWKQLIFSPDLSLLATETIKQQTSNVRVVETMTGKERFSCPDKELGHTGLNDFSVFSRDGSLLALQLRSAEAGSAVYETSQMKPNSDKAGRKLTLPGQRITAFSPDNTLLAASADAGVSIFDISSGQGLLTLHAGTGILFSNNGRTLLTDNGSLWDATTPPKRDVHRANADRIAKSIRGTYGAAALELISDTQSAGVCEFSRDGRWFVAGVIPDLLRHGDGISDRTKCILLIWDTKSRTTRVITSLLEKQGSIFSNWPFGIPLAISNDGQRILVNDQGWNAWIIDATNGDILHRLSCHNLENYVPDSRQTAAFSDDGSRAFAGVVWDVKTGQQITHPDLREFIAFAKSKEKLKLAIDRLSTETAAKGSNHFLHLDPIGRLALVSNKPEPNGRNYSGVAKFIWKGPIEFRDIATNKTVCTLIVTDDGRWLAAAADGRYDSSDDGEVKWAYWSGFENGSQINVGATKKKYYRPGLLQQILAGKDQPAAAPIAYGDIVEIIGSMAVYEKTAEN